MLPSCSLHPGLTGVFRGVPPPLTCPCLSAVGCPLPGCPPHMPGSHMLTQFTCVHPVHTYSPSSRILPVHTCSDSSHVFTQFTRVLPVHTCSPSSCVLAYFGCHFAWVWSGASTGTALGPPCPPILRVLSLQCLHCLVRYCPPSEEAEALPPTMRPSRSQVAPRCMQSIMLVSQDPDLDPDLGPS